MEPEGSLPHSQVTAICLSWTKYIKRNKSNEYLYFPFTNTYWMNKKRIAVVTLNILPLNNGEF